MSEAGTFSVNMVCHYYEVVKWLEQNMRIYDPKDKGIMYLKI
jgi:hypothetical protein